MQTVEKCIQLAVGEGTGMPASRKGSQVIHNCPGDSDAERHAGVAHHSQNAGSDAPELHGRAAHDGAIDRALEHSGAKAADS